MTTIDAFIERKQPFAVYRIPGEKIPCLVTQEEGAVRLIYDLQELNGQRGFVIAPFRPNETCPILLIQSNGPGQPLLLADDADAVPRDIPSTDYPSCSEEYAECFRTFISALRDKTFEKLVLSRKLTIGKPSAFSPSLAFRAACQRYIHSYIYLCYTPQTGIWLGSTPEIILSGEKDDWHTVALAGTQPLQDGKLPQVWDEKNRKEQEYVSSYIRGQLLSLGIHSTENGPYPASVSYTHLTLPTILRV